MFAVKISYVGTSGDGSTSEESNFACESGDVLEFHNELGARALASDTVRLVDCVFDMTPGFDDVRIVGATVYEMIAR